MKITGINPTTGEPTDACAEMTEANVDSVLTHAAEAFQSWKRTAVFERAGRMHAVAEQLHARKADFAELMAREMGKPVSQGRAELDKCVWCCEFYAEQAGKFLETEMIKTDASKSFITFEPLGILLAIMPWNFPFWQVFRAAVPALMAGNAVMLKHASNVFGCALAIENVFSSAGLPKNIFRTLLIGSKRISPLIDHPLIAAVTLTGSTEAGRSVAAAAGKALKKSVLELGGSDPYVILADADLEQAAETCVNSRLINTGQSCISAKRFIVLESVRAQFSELVIEKMCKREPGDPTKEGTTLGPLARLDLRHALQQQVDRTVAEGAKLALGGKIPQGKGAFYPPTVLTSVTRAMTAFREETFGPVAAIVAAKNEAEAIELANDSSFGLGAAIFTRDLKRGEEIAAKELQAGCCFVNDFVRSDPRLPFGGIKESGYGRELGLFGIREFVNAKTVYLK
jgi:succinate-semialdehyde dehydrogenase / glutarate-semialdehyde dehydrogenase